MQNPSVSARQRGVGGWVHMLLFAECTVDSAVIATVASAGYASAMLRLAHSAHAVGFPCLVVQPYTAFPQLSDPLVRALSVPIPPLLPRPLWCSRKRYGWRRSHLHRTRMWRVVLESGYASKETSLWRWSCQQWWWQLRLSGDSTDSNCHRPVPVLLCRYDLLAIDLDWSFLDMRAQPLQWFTPIPALRAARTPRSLLFPNGARVALSALN